MMAASFIQPGHRLRSFTVAVAVAAGSLALLAGCGSEPLEVTIEEAGPAVTARSSVDRAVATTGDLITFRVTVDYREDHEVQVAEPGAEIAGFRIVDLGAEPVVEERGRRTEERWYELRADLVGSYVLPPVTVLYRRLPQDAAAKQVEGVEGSMAVEPAVGFESVETSAIFVEVESVLPSGEQAGDIRDLKPLQQVTGPIPWKWITLGALLAALAAVAAFVTVRRRKGRLDEPPIPPHELAFGQLARLRQTNFEDPAEIRRFYFAISEVVRAYVEGRFGLNATDLTTEEIVRELPQVEELLGPPGEGLERFLEDTDQVKFADREVEEQDIEFTYENALRFVEDTQPAAPEEEEAA